jgi:hypothetical protein
MKTRQIPKQFETDTNLGYKNLLVSGCSFTYNNSENSAVTWPYYLKDLAGIDQVYDCSLPGAGNYHICHSTIWALETNNFDPKDTLVIIMWSSHNRDDAIISANSLNTFPMKFSYNNSVVSGISGGNHPEGKGNAQNQSIKDIDQIKTIESRTVENYLYVSMLYHYLSQRQYKFLFLDYLDRSIPNRGYDFEIRNYLDDSLKSKYHDMVEYSVENLYRFAIKNDLLDADDFHPSPKGHLLWTKKYLLPFLKSNYKL